MFTNINMHQNGIFNLLTAGLGKCPELHAGYIPLLIKIVHRSALGDRNLFQHRNNFFEQSSPLVTV
jgi:hypothetical protein